MEQQPASSPAASDEEGAGTGGILGSAVYEMSPGKIAHTRDFVREFLFELRSRHGMNVSGRAVDTAQLIVSELATNVAKYAPGPCQVDLEASGGLLRISVWDSGTLLPAPEQADPSRVGRHGLEIVLLACRSFSVHRAPVGKRVRVEIPLHDSLGQTPA
ncbi:ATP-binding protein [Streptomyces sp. NPDC102283]|uniref:ATP-binding protein n=1 Tax=Streptomyces sp. NPDC102283 TaxID=3366155 RepID=UPI00382C4742